MSIIAHYLQQPQLAEVSTEVRCPLDAQAHQSLEGGQGLEESPGDVGAVPELEVGQVGELREVINVGGSNVLETE